MSSALAHRVYPSAAIWRRLVVFAIGIATTVAVLWANTTVLSESGVNLLSFSAWFVLPVGAILGGILAASGYYFGSRLLQVVPTLGSLASMVGVAALAWSVGLYLDYAIATFADGTRVADSVSFLQYTWYAAEHTRLRMGRGLQFATGELGIFGIVRQVLQLLGFMLGGASVWGFLSDRPACADCQRFLSTRSVAARLDPTEVQPLLANVGVPYQAISLDVRLAVQSGGFNKVSLELYHCGGCLQDWLGAVAHHPGEKVDDRRLTRRPMSAEAAKQLRLWLRGKRSSLPPAAPGARGAGVAQP